MLSDFCCNDCVSVSLSVYFFHNIRSCKSFRMIRQRMFLFIFLNLLFPFLMTLLFHLFIQDYQNFFDISGHTRICENIFIYFCRININLQNFRMMCKFLCISSHTVTEPCTDHDQKVTLAHSKIRRFRSMHSKHSRVQLICSRKCSFSHQRIRHRRINFMCKFH